MGIGISDWHLAREVSRLGHLGVISGTGIDVVIPRRLQLGDIGGHIRRALSNFPIPEIADKVIKKYFRPEGRSLNLTFRQVPQLRIDSTDELVELSVCANFAEVWLAKEGHNGVVGVNYLEKIQMAHLSSLYGAMLAGVDFVLMGAGIPIQIAAVIDKLAAHEPAAYRIAVEGQTADKEHWVTFDPKCIIAEPTAPLKRPNFLPIVSSATLAEMLVTRSGGAVNGLIVEGHIAGGHNAPPRGKLKLNETQEPIYGERDEADLVKIKELGLPFWLAGGFASPEKIEEAISYGAAGVQIGSIFALSKESGLRPDFKKEIIRQAFAGVEEVRTDPYASPSGFPFKVVTLPETLATPEIYETRPRICDVTRLRRPYVKPNGAVGYRCPAEPITAYVEKGGKEEDTYQKKCLCNALLAGVGLDQVHKDGFREPPIVTLGRDLSFLPHMITGPDEAYTAEDVINYLTGKRPSLLA
jgi:NAD(P)H-dependent flavin oxidoreductase YrpB (nitropropane dioxygenase family)